MQGDKHFLLSIWVSGKLHSLSQQQKLVWRTIFRCCWLVRKQLAFFFYWQSVCETCCCFGIFPVLAYIFMMKTNALVLKGLLFAVDLFERLGVSCSRDIREGIYSLREGKCSGLSVVSSKVCYCLYWGVILTD